MNYRTGLARWLSSSFRSLPSPFLQLTDSLRFLIGSRHSPLLFFHVPKSGGTSISRLLYGKNLPHVSAHSVRRVFPAYFASRPSFVLIRNPLLRAISAYNFVLRGGTSDVWVDYHPIYDDPSFADADNYYQKILPSLIRDRVNPVFLPQSIYFMSGGRIIVDQVFVLEEMRPLLLFLSSHIGNRPMPKLNSSPISSSCLKISSNSFESLARIYSVDIEVYSSYLKIDSADFLRIAKEKYTTV